jgi:hypothetical protein
LLQTGEAASQVRRSKHGFIVNMSPSPAFVLLLSMMFLRRTEIVRNVDLRIYLHCHVIKVTACRNAFG